MEIVGGVITALTFEEGKEMFGHSYRKCHNTGLPVLIINIDTEKSPSVQVQSPSNSSGRIDFAHAMANSLYSGQGISPPIEATARHLGAIPARHWSIAGPTDPVRERWQVQTMFLPILSTMPQTRALPMKKAL